MIKGGHYIGRIFNRLTDEFNHFAQNRSFNQGAYRSLERSWDQALQQGQKVRVEIVPGYNEKSLRPDTLGVKQRIDGVQQNIIMFTNQRGGGF